MVTVVMTEERRNARKTGFTCVHSHTNRRVANWVEEDGRCAGAPGTSPQTELQGWAKESGSTLLVMSVPSGTPGTGRTNARRRRLVTLWLIGQACWKQLRSKDKVETLRATQQSRPHPSLGKLKQSSDSMTYRWEFPNALGCILIGVEMYLQYNTILQYKVHRGLTL